MNGYFWIKIESESENWLINSRLIVQLLELRARLPLSFMDSRNANSLKEIALYKNNYCFFLFFTSCWRLDKVKWVGILRCWMNCLHYVGLDNSLIIQLISAWCMIHYSILTFLPLGRFKLFLFKLPWRMIVEENVIFVMKNCLLLYIVF